MAEIEALDFMVEIEAFLKQTEFNEPLEQRMAEQLDVDLSKMAGRFKTWSAE